MSSHKVTASNQYITNMHQNSAPPVDTQYIPAATMGYPLNNQYPMQAPMTNNYIQPMQMAQPAIQVQPTPVAMTTVVRPDDHAVLALLSCLFCFCPTGLIAVIFAFNSRAQSDRQNYDQGQRDATRGLICSILSIVLGFTWILGVSIGIPLASSSYSSYSIGN